MLNLLYSILTKITLTVFVICITASSINIWNCISKYLKINKKISAYKNGQVLLSDLSSLSSVEFYLWTCKFLYLYDFIDTEIKAENFLSKTYQNGTLSSDKFGLPVTIVISSPKDEELSLSECRRFLSKLTLNNSSLGIIVSHSELSQECKSFLSGLTSAYEIRILTSKKIIELNNSIRTFPTTIS